MPLFSTYSRSGQYSRLEAVGIRRQAEEGAMTVAPWMVSDALWALAAAQPLAAGVVQPAVDGRDRDAEFVRDLSKA
jgi:hypothetical protein